MLNFDISLEADGATVDGVHVRRVAGREAISEAFRFAVDLACAASAGLPDSVHTGAEVSLVLRVNGAVVRRVHGLVSEFESGLETTGDYRTYTLTLVPRIHRLALVFSPSVYVGNTVSEILDAELAKYALEPPSDGRSHDYEVQLLEPPTARELTVQYGESAFAFLSRLTESLGISFFFEHDERRDRVVFTDHGGRFRPCPGASVAPFDATGSASGVHELRETRRVVPRYYQVRDHNYRRQAPDVEGEYELDVTDVAGGVVEHGSHAQTPEEARALAQIRAEEQRTRSVEYHGKSTLVGLTAGARTTLRDHAHLEPLQGFELLVTEVTHEAVLPTPWDAATVSSYSNRFVAIPGAVRFRPAQKTPRPRMPGVMTGVIQPGPSGEVGGVAQLDEHGRYRVMMHFDLEGSERPVCSPPVRMMQPFVGQTHGVHLPLRRGTEVLIAFTNGDPDRPVILGAVPNVLAPSVVGATDSHLHRLRSPGGTVVEFGTTSHPSPPTQGTPELRR